MYTELWYMPSTPRLLYRFKKQKKTRSTSLRPTSPEEEKN